MKLNTLYENIQTHLLMDILILTFSTAFLRQGCHHFVKL
jgi:hypothetical protein